MKDKIRGAVVLVSAFLAMGFMGGVETTPAGESALLPALCAMVCIIISVVAYIGG